MNAQKVAITMPENLIKQVDILSSNQGLSRSRYITLAVAEKIEKEKERFLTDSYDRVFSDEAVQREQLETAKCFEGVGSQGGQEW
jgi:hypothetical protein